MAPQENNLNHSPAPTPGSDSIDGITPALGHNEPTISIPTHTDSAETHHDPETAPKHAFNPTSIYPEATSSFAANPMQPAAHSFNDTSVQTVVNEPASTPGNSLASSNSDQPVPVVKVLSVRGVEYGMMTITLWIVAAALAGMLVSIINGGASFTILALPIALLLVCVPVFGFFFLRLKNAELANPSLRLEPSKRRFSQITQFLAFLVCLINVIVFVYLIMGAFGGDSHTSWGKAIGDLLVILVVAGGVLAYYWVDEHKLVK